MSRREQARTYESHITLTRKKEGSTRPPPPSPPWSAAPWTEVTRSPAGHRLSASSPWSSLRNERGTWNEASRQSITLLDEGERNTGWIHPLSGGRGRWGRWGSVYASRPVTNAFTNWFSHKYEKSLYGPSALLGVTLSRHR